MTSSLRVTTSFASPTRVAALAAGLVLSVAACGGSDDVVPAATSDAPSVSAPAAESPSAAVPPSNSSPAPSTEPSSEPAQSVEPTTAPAGLFLTVVGDDRNKRAVVGGSTTEAGGGETLQGKLVLSEGACFYATAPQGAPVLLVFPEGTTTDGSRQPAVVVGGTSFSVGSSVSLTGAPVELSEQEAAAVRPCFPKGGAFLVSAVTG